jgi:hypothetical protein
MERKPAFLLDKDKMGSRSGQDELELLETID